MRDQEERELYEWFAGALSPFDDPNARFDVASWQLQTHKRFQPSRLRWTPWPITAIALFGFLLVVGLTMRFHNGLKPGAQAPHRTTASLPSGYLRYSDILKAIGPVLRRTSSVPVLLPSSIPGDGRTGPIVDGKWIDVMFDASTSGYRLTLGYGLKLPANSPHAPITSPQFLWGNAPFLMSVSGAHTQAGLRVNTTFVTPYLPNAAQGTVDLGNGITGTNFVSGAGASQETGIQWQERGWTFIIPPSPSSQQPDATAANLAAQFRTIRLPAPHGTASFGLGPDAPSVAMFRLRGSWYAVEANGWHALNFASNMQ